MKLRPTSAYGVRLYQNGSSLVMHHDKVVKKYKNNGMKIKEKSRKFIWWGTLLVFVFFNFFVNIRLWSTIFDVSSWNKKLPTSQSFYHSC